MKTGIIRFNIRDRKRLHRGVDRAFDVAAVVDMINSPAVQERVKMRDLHGFYGHWPREQFGINPSEGGFVDGRQVSLEPALVTTYLKAFPDGTIEHEAEFADSTPGRAARRLFNSKLGGFSTAFTTRQVGKSKLPVDFGGLDYVYEPNYTENRGYKVVFDSVTFQPDTAMTLDGVDEYLEVIADLTNKLSILQTDYQQLSTTFTKISQENDAYLGQLAKMKAKPAKVLDSARTRLTSRPSKFAGAAEFQDSDLPSFAPEEKGGDESAFTSYLAKFGL